ncbi:MAG TPA: thermonuclease family protein [Burkholderiales bacterium]|nr:thermonuclease family protein [Burkholderiales bacterium]
MRSFAAHVLVGLGCTSHAATIDGTAINGADGDTVTVVDASKTQHKIRIGGIDAPERGQPFGTRSKENLERLVSRKDVTAACHKTDRYGRHVCKVWVQSSDCATCGKTQDAGHAQIIAGMTWWYREDAKEQADDRLTVTVAVARLAC